MSTGRASGRFFFTPSAVRDFLTIFPAVRNEQDALDALIATAENAKLHHTKPNGFQVYRATKTRHFLLVGPPRSQCELPPVVACGPPSEAHARPASRARSGESATWWHLEPGDLEAPRPEVVEGQSPRRENLSPLVRELRMLREEAGLSQAQMAARFPGGMSPKSYRDMERGNEAIFSKNREFVAAQVDALKRQLGLKRGPGRPPAPPGHVPNPQLEFRKRVPQEMADWIAAKGGNDFIWELLLDAYEQK